MKASQWENDFTIFMHTIINIFKVFLDSSATLGHFGGTWWSPSKDWRWLLVILAGLVDFLDFFVL